MKNNQHRTVMASNDSMKVRLDKWLWAARFFKTRAMATEAIKGGKIHINDARVKPSHWVKIGEKVRIRKAQQEQIVVVEELSDKRGSAPIAQTLYKETDESIKNREIQSSKRREFYLVNPTPDKRPNKKQRRNIIKFKQEKNFD
jgi:ribosome-associated heat shock protein Hsp15